MVVLALIGIFTALVVPRFGNGWFQDDTRKALNWLIVKTDVLKSNARKGHQAFALCYDPASHSFNIFAGERDDQNPGFDDLEPVGQYVLPPQLRVENIVIKDAKETDFTACIQFYPEGYSDWARIFLTDDDNRDWILEIQPFVPGMVLQAKGEE